MSAHLRQQWAAAIDPNASYRAVCVAVRDWQNGLTDVHVVTAKALEVTGGDEDEARALMKRAVAWWQDLQRYRDINGERIPRTANWRAMQATPFWSLYDAVIATDRKGSKRDFEVWTFGAPWATRHSLNEAKDSVEEVYGSLTWRRVPMPPVIYNHYYFGPTTEMTDPMVVYVVDHLPRI